MMVHHDAPVPTAAEERLWRESYPLTATRLQGWHHLKQVSAELEGQDGSPVPKREQAPTDTGHTEVAFARKARRHAIPLGAENYLGKPWVKPGAPLYTQEEADRIMLCRPGDPNREALLAAASPQQQPEGIVPGIVLDLPDAIQIDGRATPALEKCAGGRKAQACRLRYGDKHKWGR